MSRLKKIGAWIWYPWLGALFPVVYLYSRNFGKVFASEFLLACGFAVIAAGLLMGLFWLILRDTHRAGAMSLVVIIGFFVYGPVVEITSSGETDALASLPLPFLTLMLIVTSLVAIGLAFWPSSAVLRKVTPNFNILAGALVAFNLASLTIPAIQSSSTPLDAPIPGVTRAPKVNNDAQHPDIYYIVLDAYPSNEGHLNTAGIDNSEFTSDLEKRGFYVAYGSRSNYPITVPSLASALSMRYLERPEDLGGLSTINYVRAQIADSNVAKDLLGRGYTYIFVLSGMDTVSKIADLTVDYYPDGYHVFPYGAPRPINSYQRSFWPLLFDATMLANTEIDMSGVSEERIRPVDLYNGDRALALFDEAANIASMPEATFAVLHVILPHVPIRFTKDGQFISDPDERRLANRKNRHQAYVDELAWLNRRTLEMVDDVLSQSTVPPIIIIQGDHGSVYGSPHPNGEDKYFKILSAYHFPGENGQAGLSQDITSVNSFRVMFNTYFGGSYEMLDSRFFRLNQGYDDVFDVREVFDPPD